MVKVAFVGAGSTVFARTLLGDLLHFDELRDAHIALHDVDPERLRTTEVVARKVATALDASPTVTATLDRAEALDGCDFVINMIQVAGYKPGTVVDFEVPKRYGLRQTIADTLGIGGIMRGLRTIPVVLDICADMQRLCPDALLINYSNPMAMLCWAVSRATPIKAVGLCHSVFGTAWELARDCGVDYRDVSYLCAGINHMAFYLRLEHRGRDMYPMVRKVVDEGRVPDYNKVRYDVFSRLGYFVTESSEHFSEYVPWFIKRDRPDLVERFNIPLDEYIRRCEAQIAGWERMRERLESDEDVEVRRSGEYGSYIVHSMVTGKPRVIYGNVPNAGVIDNLPDGCSVEVPCLVDHNGIQPTRIGAMPPHLAALITTNVNVQSLTVEAALTRRREHVYHAAMLDPHTSAELDLDQIWSLVDDLIEAHGGWLPAYT